MREEGEVTDGGRRKGGKESFKAIGTLPTNKVHLDWVIKPVGTVFLEV